MNILNTANDRPARRRVRLLYVGDAALARECLGRPGGSIDVVEAVPGSNGTFDPPPADVRPGEPLPFEIVLIEHGHPGVDTLAILKDAASRKLHVPVVIVADWDEELAVLALKLGASDYVVKSRASFRAVYFRLNRLIAHSALLNEQSRLRDAHAATVDQERANRDDVVRRLAAVQTARENAEQRLNEAVAANKQTRQARLADAVAAAGELVRREGHFAARLAEAATAARLAEASAAATRDVLQARLLATEAAREAAGQRHASEIAAAAAHLADYQRQAETRSAAAAAAANTLEARLVEQAAALRRAEEQAAVDRQSSMERASQRQAEFDAQLAEEVLKREAVEAEYGQARTALEQARQDRAADATAAAEHLSQRESVHLSRLADAASTREQLERHLSDAHSALQSAEEHAAAEQNSARQATERQTEVEAELVRETANREALRQELADARLAFARAEEQAAVDRQTSIEHASQRQAEFDAQLAEEVLKREAVEAEYGQARQSLVGAEERIQQLEGAHKDERADFERAQMAIEADLAHQREEYTALHQILDQTRASAQKTLERLSMESAIEQARLETLVAERDAQLREHAARTLASDEAAVAAMADVERRLHVTLVARDRDSRAIAQLQEQLKHVAEELDAARRQREVLKTTADRVPQLQTQIDNIRAENRRQFDHTPVNMWRCSRAGAITQVNRALASLLGYATPEEVQKLDFAGTVFESGDELQWIIDRCLASRSTESVDTTWRKKNGSRIIVRVRAVATSADSIDLVAEEFTHVRELEEQLRNAQRMEAVARYGSEVAVTCHSLLRHVKQEGQQWLARMESDTARYQGELLLDDVTRAAGFLGQLAAYGNEQKNVPDLVDVNKVLRDIGPVLKRVAGDNIDLVLPKASRPLNLDVEAGRVERMLVNIAAYGRGRMPLGGRLMIDVASVTLDRTFVAKYPNVRPGAHVLLTVNEVRGAVRQDLSAAVHTQASGAAASPSDNPGVDLGTLQALVSDCGGHLWMMAEPPGDMVLKIHLPRRVLDGPDPRGPAKRPGPSGWINRAFSARH